MDLLPSYIGLDTETNITEIISERECYVVSMGTHDWQIVIDWKRCTDEVKRWVKAVCECEQITKIIHNSSFDLKVFWNEGIDVRNIHDTMVIHQLIRNGAVNHDISLADMVYEYLYVQLEKELQTSYNGNELTEEQIAYAALDVQYLPTCRRIQILDAANWHLERAVALENSTAEALARMEYDGVKIDPERWLEAKEWAEKELYQAIERLKESIVNDPRLLQECMVKKWLSIEDRVVINWKSHTQMKAIAEHCFGMTGFSKPVLQKTVKQCTIAQKDETLPKQQREDAERAGQMFLDMLNGNYTAIEKYLVENHVEWMLEQGFFLPKGYWSINWNSTPQMKTLGLIIAPHLRSMEAKYISKRDHPFFRALVEYNQWQKRIGTYGEDFLRHIQPDGRIHTRYKNLVSTGRSASRDPNMQNIPAKGIVGDKYRRAFIPEEGHSFSVQDYASQEIVLAATIYREPVWLEALKMKHDLHSKVGAMLFPKEWKETKEKECNFDTTFQQCKCKGHSTLRGIAKTFNFG